MHSYIIFTLKQFRLSTLFKDKMVVTYLGTNQQPTYQVELPNHCTTLLPNKMHCSNSNDKTFGTSIPNKDSFLHFMQNHYNHTEELFSDHVSVYLVAWLLFYLYCPNVVNSVMLPFPPDPGNALWISIRSIFFCDLTHPSIHVLYLRLMQDSWERICSVLFCYVVAHSLAGDSECL